MATKMTDKEAAEKWRAQKEKEKKYWVRQKLILAKAKAAGITVTDAEVDAEMAK